ncbi:MAG: hypothetical protein NT069_18515 [Planctomycetota bacterium]|nr:hypothetical protein [Planctomycetota bacterium]
MIDEEEEKLLFERRIRTCRREDRAVARAFYTCGLLGAVPPVLWFVVQMLWFGEWVPAIFAIVVGLPVGCLLFGTGPAIFAMLWMNMFPESRLGDESLGRR